MSVSVPVMSVRQVVRDVVASSDDLDMRVLVARVVERVPESERAAAFEEVLPVFVRAVMNETRQVLSVGSPVVSEAAVREAARVSRTPQNPSRKRAVIRSEFERMLDAIYPDAAGRSKRLREFTVVDLDAVSERCRDLASANAVKADRFSRLAAAVRDAGVETVGDLPGGVLPGLLAA